MGFVLNVPVCSHKGNGVKQAIGFLSVCVRVEGKCFSSDLARTNQTRESAQVVGDLLIGQS